MPRSWKDPVEVIAAKNADIIRLNAALSASEDRYQRECLGLNNEGDPIGGDPPMGWKPRAVAAEAERDQWRADAERLAAHVENLMEVYQHPDDRLCCSGHDCGCYGATKHQEAEHYAKEALSAHNKLKSTS